MNFMNIPNDDTGAVIKELINMGITLNENIDIDFFVAFELEDDGKSFMKDSLLIEFNLDLEFDDELECWTCFCSKNIALNYNEIKKVEEQLNTIAQKYSGQADGFSANVN